MAASRPWCVPVHYVMDEVASTGTLCSTSVRPCLAHGGAQRHLGVLVVARDDEVVVVPQHPPAHVDQVRADPVARTQGLQIIPFSAQLDNMLIVYRRTHTPPDTLAASSSLALQPFPLFSST